MGGAREWSEVRAKKPGTVSEVGRWRTSMEGAGPSSARAGAGPNMEARSVWQTAQVSDLWEAVGVPVDWLVAVSNWAGTRWSRASTSGCPTSTRRCTTTASNAARRLVGLEASVIRPEAFGNVHSGGTDRRCTRPHRGFATRVPEVTRRRVEKFRPPFLADAATRRWELRPPSNHFVRHSGGSPDPVPQPARTKADTAPGCHPNGRSVPLLRSATTLGRADCKLQESQGDGNREHGGCESIESGS
jgi:hypothetical protein